MKIVTSFAQLTAKLEEVAHKQQTESDDAFRTAVSSWRLDAALFGAVPTDPFSSDYKTYQLQIYEQLTQRTYSTSYEETEFDKAHELKWPYPYGTKSAQTVGENLVSYGWVIKQMDLPANARILEIGSGFGSLTVHLAQMGYRVTCLDISPALLDFVQARTAAFPQPVQTICGDMATAPLNGPYNAVVFNASLHHSLEHRAVIRRLADVLLPDGILVFKAEPIVPANSEIVPYPWGMRLDGLSVWSICQWGWLELGFQEPYFVNLMKGEGWQLTRYNLGLSGQTDIWIAARQARRPTTMQTAVSNGEYAVDPETELIQLRQLVAAYENGRFMRLMKWLKQFR